MRNKHRAIFEQFSATFPVQTVRRWEQMVSEWKVDKSSCNPYKEPASCKYCRPVVPFYAANDAPSATTVQDVRLELAKEDAANSARGVVSPHEVTLTAFLTMGLDLEEQQYVSRLCSPMYLAQFSRRHLRLEVSQTKGARTSKQLADLEGKRTSLYNRIQRWREAQLVYTPCVGTLLIRSLAAATATATAESLLEPAESILLHLPSSLAQCHRQSPDMSTVIEKECRLRVAQADEALAEIRHQRRIITGLWQFKKLNVDGTGNRAATRMRTLYNRFNLRTQRCAARYRMARTALLILNPGGPWQSRLQVLKDADIRGPGKEDGGLGNSRFEPSWIWLVPRVSSAPDMGDSEKILDDSLQVEWSKSHARKERWEEEVLLVEEEMRRVILYHNWHGQWWRSRGACRSDVDSPILHGVAAYAEKQAHLSEQLAHSCAVYWLPTFKSKDMSPDWEIVADVTPVQCGAPLATDEVEDDVDDESPEKIDDEERGQDDSGDESDYAELDFFEIGDS
jgi:hypothetical protein